MCAPLFDKEADNFDFESRLGQERLLNVVHADALPSVRSSCRMCPRELKGGGKHYCSGECMQRAKLCGIYGKEGEASS